MGGWGVKTVGRSLVWARASAPRCLQLKEVPSLGLGSVQTHHEAATQLKLLNKVWINHWVRI